MRYFSSTSEISVRAEGGHFETTCHMPQVTEGNKSMLTALSIWNRRQTVKYELYVYIQGFFTAVFNIYKKSVYLPGHVSVLHPKNSTTASAEKWK